MNSHNLLTLEEIIEPPHDKTNKMTVRPAKTQIDQPGHPHSLRCALIG